MSVAGHNPRLGGENDHYPTPEWCVHRLLDRVYLPRGRWIEPCAGGGAIIRAVDSHLATKDAIEWSATEIREDARKPLSQAIRFGQLAIGNFLHDNRPDHEASVVLTNPPYEFAEQIIRHSLIVAPNAWVAMLLRLNFYAGEERSKWMECHVPDAHVLPNRPSFRAKGSDSCEYAWMIWPPGAGLIKRFEGHLRLLGSTSLEVRKRDKALALEWEGIS